MKLTIIGASAGVGLHCVHRALERGHQVTTLSRSVDAYPTHPHLNPIKGSATHIDDLHQAITGAEAVLVTLGTGTSTKPTTLYTDAATALIKLQNELNTPIPFIILTGFGAGNSGQYHTWYMNIIFSTLLNAVYQNKTMMEQHIAASGLNWEFVRPGLLTNKPLTEKYRAETRYYKGMGIGSIPRQDVADFMVKQAENPSYLGQYVALASQ